MSNRTLVRVLGSLAALSLLAAACGDDDDGQAGTTTTTAAPPDGGGELTIEVIDTVSVEVGEDSTEAIEPQAGTDRGNVNGALSLGSVLPSSGDLAVLGEPMNEAVAMAIEEINAAGGVFGQDVALDARDSGTDEQVASDAVDALLGTDIDAIIGPASSRVSLSVIDKITGAGVTQCSPSNTGLDFTTYEDGGYYFRTAPPDNLQARVMADELIIPDGHETIGIIALADSYGQGFANSLEEQLEDAGLEVVVNQAYDPNGKTRLRRAGAGRRRR
jgi:ABC-type branched-subunit amino acid transport system substrate-binding protein